MGVSSTLNRPEVLHKLWRLAPACCASEISQAVYQPEIASMSSLAFFLLSYPPRPTAAYAWNQHAM